MGRKCERCNCDLEIVKHQGKSYFKKCTCKAMDAIAKAVKEVETRGNFFHTGTFFDENGTELLLDCVGSKARFQIDVDGLKVNAVFSKDQAEDILRVLEDFVHRNKR